MINSEEPDARQRQRAESRPINLENEMRSNINVFNFALRDPPAGMRLVIIFSLLRVLISLRPALQQHMDAQVEKRAPPGATSTFSISRVTSYLLERDLTKFGGTFDC